jgi:polysaccharide deacetylase family protein (PEP-CTERM system associated)
MLRKPKRIRPAESVVDGASDSQDQISAKPAPLVPFPAVEQGNALTIDVEDYFHVEAFADTIDRRDWAVQPRRVAQNTNKLLDMLGEAAVTGTFFMLGWAAERHPELVHRIVAEGHELASHGSDHRRLDQQSRDQFRCDVRRSKRLLEDIAGAAVVGYRAPTFSIGHRTQWAHAILAEEGFRYSSSIYPIAHDLYGEPTAPRRPFQPLPGFIEIPLTTYRILGHNLPSAGGGYFRLFPYAIAREALRRSRKQLGTPCIFYVHPWEIDPDQPRQSRASRLSRFRHYVNLHRTEERLRRLLHDFSWSRVDRIFLGEEASPLPLIEAWLKHPAR